MSITPSSWAQVARLQRKLMNSIPMSGDSDIYEKSLDIALNRIAEPESPYLAHNSYRHAKTHVLRSKQQQLPHEPYHEQQDQLSTTETVEGHAAKSELVDFVLSQAKAKSPSTCACIEGWMLGHSCEDSAQLLNTSVAAIKKTRQRFKKELLALTHGGEQ
ncbi:MAG: hypothetical protein OIF51_00010 [Cellvibrionaceae bacterium]|nr:hypothetical protein [Cellvibrionaceae bacterium]